LYHIQEAAAKPFPFLLDHGQKEADARSVKYSTGHFLLGFLRKESSVASRLLTGLLGEQGMSITAARDQITPLLEL
jgi:hypothetical protein